MLISFHGGFGGDGYNVNLISFFLLLSFVGKLDVFFPKLGDSPFLASFDLLAIFPLKDYRGQ